MVRNADEYRDLTPHLYPKTFDRAELESATAGQKAGEMVVWIALDGFLTPYYR